LYTLLVQVVLRMMEEVRSEELVKAWSKKMGPPLVTLLSAEPEVQYVALRNINLIVQRWPQILANEVKVSSFSRAGYIAHQQQAAALW
jgi:AP-1 complex subunit beta-1